MSSGFEKKYIFFLFEWVILRRFIDLNIFIVCPNKAIMLCNLYLQLQELSKTELVILE